MPSVPPWPARRSAAVSAAAAAWGVVLLAHEVVDDITLHWLTNSATSAARLYWENAGP